METAVDINQVREFWDEHICGYGLSPLSDRKSIEYLDEVRLNRYRYDYHSMPFLRRVGKAGHMVLEIGCSIGIDLAELGKLGCEVAGVDPGRLRGWHWIIECRKAERA